MSLACEQTAEMMRATASFHGDDAGWELGNQTDQRFSLRSPAQNDRARCVETDDTANILGPRSMPSTETFMIRPSS
jgi:hypothetical protein